MQKHSEKIIKTVLTTYTIQTTVRTVFSYLTTHYFQTNPKTLKKYRPFKRPISKKSIS